MYALSFALGSALLLAPCLATPLPQSLPPPQPGYHWTVHNWTQTYDSSLGNFDYVFNVTGPFVTSTYPSFPGFHAGCSGVSGTAGYTSCEIYRYTVPVDSSDVPTVLAHVGFPSDSNKEVFMNLELHETVGDDGNPHSYYGKHVAPFSTKEEFKIKPHESKADGPTPS